MKTEIGGRIQIARRNAGLTQQELADRVGISQTAVHKLECGRSKTSRRTVSLALACGVDPVWLEIGIGNMDGSVEESREAGDPSQGDAESSRGFRSQIPLLSLQEVCVWSADEEQHPVTVEKWALATVSVSDRAYAFHCIGDSMGSEFAEGDVVIVDPAISPKPRTLNRSPLSFPVTEKEVGERTRYHSRRRMVPVKPSRGSFVVVREVNGDTAMLRELVVDAHGDPCLRPWNDRYPTIPMSSEFVVCGVVVCKYKNF